MKRIFISLSCLLVAASLLFYKQLKEKNIIEASRVAAEVATLKMPLRKRYGLGYGLTMPDSFSNAGKSEWADHQALIDKNALLVEQGYTALVLPFQPSGSSPAPIRMYAAETLRQWVEASGEKVPPVDIVRNVLGMHMRDYNDNNVYALANALKVKKIYWSFSMAEQAYASGRDGALTKPTQSAKYDIVVQSINGYDQWNIGIRYTEKKAECHTIPVHEELFLQGFTECIDSLKTQLGFSQQKGGLVTVSHFDSSSIVSQNINEQDYVSNPAMQAAYLQLLGLLVPDHVAYARLDFLVKSLAATNKVDPVSENYRLLRARSMLHLGLRPYAIIELGAPQTPAEQAFLDVINGNLKGLKDKVALIEDPLLRLLAEIEYLDLNTLYSGNTDTAEVERIINVLPVWSFEVKRRLEDNDLWKQHSGLDVKEQLDKKFPLPGFSVTEIVAAMDNQSNKSKSRYEMEVTFQKHVDVVMGEQLKIGASTNASIEYLKLLEAIGQGNIVQQVLFFSNVQGNYDAAIDVADIYGKTFGGYPALMEAKSNSYNRINKTKTGRDAETAGVDADRIYQSFVYQFEPYCCSVRKQLAEDELTGSRQDYKWVHDRLEILEDAINIGIQQKNLDQNLVEELKSRFSGHPRKALIQARVAQYFHQDSDLAALYEQAINENPSNWDAVYEYATWLLRQGKLLLADKVYRQYVPFTKMSADVNPVQLSNQAYDAGNRLNWRGEVVPAQFYFNIAAALDTGSGGSVKAIAKGAMFKQNFSGAAESFHECAKHYKDVYCFQAYFGLSTVTSLRNPEISLGDDVLRELGSMDMVQAKIAMHHLAGITTEKSCQWLDNVDKTEPSLRDKGLIDLYRFLLVTLDRKNTSNDFSVCEAQQPSPQQSENVRFFQNLLILQQAAFAGDVVAAKAASQNIQKYCNGADFIKNIARGRRWSCNIEHYIAFADAMTTKSMDGVSLHEWLIMHSYSVSDTSEMNIKRAAAEAFSGDHAAAVLAINNAFLAVADQLGGMSYWPQHYELLRFCEMFYKVTGDDRYRQKLLQWTSVLQKIEPWNAWPYSFEAKYQDIPALRLKALAITQYLDKDSENIKDIPENEKAEANIWLRAHNPFIKIASKIIQ